MSVAALQDEILHLERRRRLYTGVMILVTAAVIIAGYGQANSMNSGGFISGLGKFFDYPGEIVVEAWQSGGEFFLLLIEFLPDMVAPSALNSCRRPEGS